MPTTYVFLEKQEKYLPDTHSYLDLWIRVVRVYDVHILRIIIVLYLTQALGHNSLPYNCLKIQSDLYSINAHIKFGENPLMFT